MLGADYYETDAEIASLMAEGKVPIGIGENTKIRSLFNYHFFSCLDIHSLLVRHFKLCGVGNVSSTRMQGLGKILLYLIQR